VPDPAVENRAGQPLFSTYRDRAAVYPGAGRTVKYAVSRPIRPACRTPGTRRLDLSRFDYELPSSLIAQRPLASRAASRMLVMPRGGGELVDAAFRDLASHLRPGDLLVFNDTRVMAARFLGRKPSGGRVEVMLERTLDDTAALARVRASHSPRAGETLRLEGGARVEVLGREGELFSNPTRRIAWTHSTRS